VQAGLQRRGLAELGEQLQQLATEAVFKSWNGKRAIDYRRKTNIPDNLGTAVNIVTMVFGNMGPLSATGVAFTRDPGTGQNVFFGDYLTQAQGEDIVAGIRTPKPIADMKRAMPDVYEQLLKVRETLEKHYKDVQDFEFTIQDGKVFMLQTRNGKRTGPAAVRILDGGADAEFLADPTAGSTIVVWRGRK
jgi:pyruvate,orthophosphate dikinase